MTVGLLADTAAPSDPRAVAERVARAVDVLPRARAAVGDQATVRGRRAA